MKYLKIQNTGLLDIRLVALMGGTTKSKDVFKIGQFGTGLKYTLAYLFRNNLDFKIFIGKEEVKISTEFEEIRGERFEIICINGHRTSITTKMGEDWEAWMIIRELWCNALDEGGQQKEEVEVCEGLEETTTFFVQIDSKFREVLDNWRTYFIHDLKPISTTPNYDIYSGGDSFRIYKHGVLIYENKKHIGVFSYDIKNAQINELREFQGSHNRAVLEALSTASSEAITYFLENITDAHYEGDMDYNWYISFGEHWKETIGNAKLIHQGAVDIIKSRGAQIDMDGTIVVPEKLYKFLTKEFKGIGLLMTADAINEFYEIHSETLMGKIKKALTILEECEYFISPELKFICGIFGNKQTLAQVNTSTKEIYVSERFIDLTLFQTCAMIIEENAHFTTGFSDHTREFQQHFINLYTKTLLDKNAIKL